MQIRLVRISGWGALALGTIHCLATPAVLGMGFGALPRPQLAVFLFMFLATGLSLVFAGASLLQAIPHLHEGNPLAIRIHRLCVAYFLPLGIGSVVAMGDNPFAWLTLLNALLAGASLLVRNRDA